MKKSTSSFKTQDIISSVFAVALILVIPFLINKIEDPENPLVILPFALIVVFFIANLIIRRSLKFKGYFTSKINPLTSKTHTVNTYDIPVDLMFGKMKEVIEDSNFKLADSNPSSKELLATTGMTFRSWGENLYISMNSKGNQTEIEFTSTTFFQVVSWGKNNSNLEKVLVEIEDSLTI